MKTVEKYSMGIVVFLCALLTVPATLVARTITVDDDGPADFATVQAAIDDANDGDEVVVRPGTYIGPGNRDIDFKGKAITVRGINPNDANSIASTVIDCQASEVESHRGFKFHSGESADSVVAGLTIANGYAPEEYIDDYPVSCGGAILCIGSAPTIESCVIRDNTAFIWGGGIHNEGSSLTVANCQFIGNTAATGGAMYNYLGSPKVTNCLFSGNTAQYEAGAITNVLSDPVISLCVFRDNTSKQDGGAMNFVAYCDATVTCSVFSRNSSESNGGAISIGSNSALAVTNCLFTWNEAVGIHTWVLGCGGGILCTSGSVSTIANCVFCMNSAGVGGAVHVTDYADATVTNSILWDNIALEDLDISGPVNVTYSCLQSNRPGLGNIYSDPRLVDAPNGDFHLLPNSPCIDSGHPGYCTVPGQTDLDGKPRVMGGAVDRGAYESPIPEPSILRSSPSSFHFSADTGDADLYGQTLAIWNIGGGALRWSVSETLDWLNVDPKSGDSIGEVDQTILSVNVSGLTVGQYDGELAVTFSGADSEPHIIPVSLYVHDDDGELHVPSECATIQDGIDAARPGDVVILHPRTYTGHGNRDIDFKGKAITVRSINPNDPDIVEATVVDCNEQGRGFYLNGCDGARIEGLTITNGSAANGAGVLCENGSSVILHRCVVSQCRALDGNPGGDGGAIYCDESSTVEILNSEISANFAGNGGSGSPAGNGGGIYCEGELVVRDSTIIENGSGNGGGGGMHGWESGGPGGDGAGICCVSCSSVTVRDCLISHNVAGHGGGFVSPSSGGYGGGMYIVDCDNVVVENCDITENQTGNGGAGGGVYSRGNSITIANSRLLSNATGNGGYGEHSGQNGGYGGGICCLEGGNISNCLVAGNLTGDGSRGWPNCDGGDGAGIYAEHATIRNCTIVDNVVGAGQFADVKNNRGEGGGVYIRFQASVIDSIIWDNSADQILNSDCSNVSFCNIQSGECAGINGNISADPLFIQPGYWDPNGTPDDTDDDFWVMGDYHLSQLAVGQLVESPCVDAGSNTAANLGVDIYTTRTDKVWDQGIVDMGYHYRQNVADLNDDGIVDMKDISILGSQWRQTSALPPVDVVPLTVGDGIVDIHDLAMLAKWWLWPW